MLSDKASKQLHSNPHCKEKAKNMRQVIHLDVIGSDDFRDDISIPLKNESTIAKGQIGGKELDDRYV